MHESTGSASPAVRVALPGTCGELVQGTLDGTPCLVSCPIERYSVAEVRFGTDSGWLLQPDVPKVRAALQHGLAFLGRTASHGSVQLDSDLPRGRGYGSSTADVGAMLYALGHAAGRPLTPTESAELALQVEPTDSSLFSGLALWDHRDGQLYENLGPPPALTVIVLDPGGQVDTVAYNRFDHRAALRTLAPLHREAFQVLREGMTRDDAQAVGTAATLSATAHQAILPNPLLESAVRLARDVGALGLCRAHSGTVLGLLLNPDPTEVARVTTVARQRFAPEIAVFSLPLVSGGPRLLTTDTGHVLSPLSGIGQQNAKASG